MTAPHPHAPGGDYGPADGDLVEIDPFDLPEWLGTGEVVWSATSGLRTAHVVAGEISGAGGSIGCDLLAVDEAYPGVVAADVTRVRVHRAWRNGQVLILRRADRMTLAGPGTRWGSEGVLDALARLAKAVGASPERYAVHLRIGDHV